MTSALKNNMTRRIVLMSPHPVDAYPPVRYQAELLAHAGFVVHLFTCPMKHEARVIFKCTGVILHEYALSQDTSLRRVVARARMSLGLFNLRRAYHRSIVAEIGFDPIGVQMLYSAPLRCKVVVAHLHVALIFPTQDHRTLRMTTLLPRVSLVVVADADRARILQHQIKGLPSVLTVRNLPLKHSTVFSRAPRTENFSVAYFGSLGITQGLDSVIRSMPHWPTELSLHLYSRADAASIAKWRILVEQAGVADRVHFEGWVHANDLLPTISKHHVGLSMMRPESDNERFASGASNKRYLLMAAGIAQISDRLPGVSELVEGNRVGKCVEPDNLLDIAEAVNYYYSRPSEIERIQREGPMLIESIYNYESEFQPVLDFLDTGKTGAI